MYLELARVLALWRPAFPRHVTWLRTVAVLLGLLLASGRRTVTASLQVRQREFSSWAPDYLVFSRAYWDVDVLFTAVLAAGIETSERVVFPRRLIVAVDDTCLPKTGKKIGAARWVRDPFPPHSR